ncbi:hypothetical protein C8Q76DRAFT_698887 [Earliella scabrosa]|nr:hypothetical protein C8Q76DRAFT_698887 [Earliella scabrosa]
MNACHPEESPEESHAGLVKSSQEVHPPYPGHYIRESGSGNTDIRLWYELSSKTSSAHSHNHEKFNSLSSLTRRPEYTCQDWGREPLVWITVYYYVHRSGTRECRRVRSFPSAVAARHRLLVRHQRTSSTAFAPAYLDKDKLYHIQPRRGIASFVLSSCSSSPGRVLTALDTSAVYPVPEDRIPLLVGPGRAGNQGHLACSCPVPDICLHGRRTRPEWLSGCNHETGVLLASHSPKAPLGESGAVTQPSRLGMGVCSYTPRG